MLANIRHFIDFVTVRFDDRDVGLSTWLDRLGMPNLVDCNS